jgi:4-oxalocrotonate tautomerase
MPFVNIQILKGQSEEHKKEIAHRVTEVLSDVADLPMEAIWVVFEDVESGDWYVGGNKAVKPSRSGR